MNETKKVSIRVLFIIILVGLLIPTYGCKSEKYKNKKDGLAIVSQSLPIDKSRETASLSAWSVDWQWMSGVEDFKKTASDLGSIQVFAAYFKDGDRLFYTDENKEAIPQIMEVASINRVSVNLTIVNDRFIAEGAPVLKDSEMVGRLVATKQSRNKHIEDIVELMAIYEFDGVEIDYENIHMKDWSNVCRFYEELFEVMEAKGKSVRIILEPGAPIERLNLPTGPSYGIMAYNLYGAHSGPGPKANLKFIEDVTKQALRLPGEPFIALAIGGFDWSETQAVQLTEEEIKVLLKRSVHAPIRDVASGSLSFSYTDDNNVKHTVWYADAITLEQWIECILDAGISTIGLWKLGGFDEQMISYINYLDGRDN